jgi:hypothetical protein
MASDGISLNAIPPLAFAFSAALKYAVLFRSDYMHAGKNVSIGLRNLLLLSPQKLGRFSFLPLSNVFFKWRPQVAFKLHLVTTRVFATRSAD